MVLSWRNCGILYVLAFFASRTNTLLKCRVLKQRIDSSSLALVDKYPAKMQGSKTTLVIFLSFL